MPQHLPPELLAQLTAQGLVSDPTAEALAGQTGTPLFPGNVDIAAGLAAPGTLSDPTISVVPEQPSAASPSGAYITRTERAQTQVPGPNLKLMPQQPQMQTAATLPPAPGFGGIEQAFREQSAAQAEEADIRSRQMTEQADLYRDLRAKLDTAEELRQSHERLRRFKAEEAERNLAEATDLAAYRIPDEEVKQLRSVVNDPNATNEDKEAAQRKLEESRGIQEQSMGKRVMAGIAMALGAYGAALTGGKNYAMEIVQQGIEEDIARQKEELAQKRGRVGEMKTAYQRMLERFGDEAQADLAYEAYLRNQSTLKAQEMAAKAGGPLAEAGARTVAAENQIALERIKADFRQRAWAAEAEGRGAAAAAPMIEGLRPTGKTTITKTGLEAVAKAREAEINALSAIDDAIAKREEFGINLVGPEKAAMDVVQNNLVTMIGRASDAGTLQAGERAAFEKMIGNLSGFGWVQPRLRELREMFLRKAEANYRARGWEKTPDSGSEDAAAASNPYMGAFGEL